jgi:hypothetical protein
MMRYQPGDRDLITTAGRLWRLTKARELEQRERQARLTVQTVDGLTIYREPAPDQRCVVESLLYHGLTILAGRPKTGKSFLALQLALSVSQGTDFLKARPILRPGRVLYVALEEAQARTSVRMRKFQHSESVLLQNISMLYQLLPMMDGGIEQLDETMRVQTPNLVILDTFLAFVGMSAAGRDVLRSEYREVQALHTLAEKHDTAILVVHHTRKPTIGGNGLDAVAGSTGITAAADAVWTVERQDVGVCSLDIVGREAEEQTLALRFGQDDGWELEGTGERVKAMKDEREILTLLRNEAPLSAGRIATLLRMNANRTRSILYDLHQRGVVAKNTGGSFRLSEGGGNDAN